MTLSANEATRLISVIDHRIQKSLGRGTVLEITYGDVDVVNGRFASVFIGGDTTASENFRIPSGMNIESGDRVRVSIDPRGDRYVEETLAPTSYAKVAIDPVRGEVLLGDGTTAPDVVLTRAANDVLGMEDALRFTRDSVQTAVGVRQPLDVNDRIRLQHSGVIAFGDGSTTPDVTLYRGPANVLKTDDVFHAVGGLRVTAPASTDGQNFEALRIVLPSNGYTGFAIYDSPTATEPVLEYAGYGAILMGPGGTTAPDVSISRDASGNLEVGGGELRSASEAWISPSMANSWVAYGGSFDTPQYRKDAQGYVHLKGLIKSGTVGSSAFTLPSGYRPAASNLYPSLSADSIGRVLVDNAGLVIPQAPSVNSWVSLSGITFKAEG